MKRKLFRELKDFRPKCSYKNCENTFSEASIVVVEKESTGEFAYCCEECCREQAKLSWKNWKNPFIN